MAAATVDSKANQANPAGVRASTRFSTYSTAPTLTPSVAPSRLSTIQDPKKDLSRSDSVSTTATTDTSIKHYSTHLDRLNDTRLSSQRYVVNEGKTEELKALALGAKLERALGRRMSGQDAVFTKKTARTVKC